MFLSKLKFLGRGRLKVLLQYKPIPLLGFIAVGLFILFKPDTATRLSILQPLMTPIDSLSQSFQDLKDYLGLKEQLAILQDQNRTLQEERAKTLEVFQENQELKKLLKMDQGMLPASQTARVIQGIRGDSSIPSLIILKGSADGTQPNSIVEAYGGLLGRITNVGKHASQILQVCDPQSRIPVYVDSPTKVEGIVAGDGTASPQLLYVQDTDTLAPGDRLLTSGTGGMYPPHKIIGTIESIKGGEIFVRPFINFATIRFAHITAPIEAIVEAQTLLVPQGP